MIKNQKKVYVYKTLKMGAFHTKNCEDFWIDEELGPNKRLIAVMDGCSMGKESVFAALLFGKVLRKIARQEFYEAFINQQKVTLKVQLIRIIEALHSETKRLKNALELETNELLATLIIGIVETEEKKAEFIVVGDGLICVDDQVVEFDQGDKPDYFSYHLSSKYSHWCEQHRQYLSVEQFSDLSISTDGIYTFKNFKNPKNQKSESEIISFLLEDKNGEEYENFLDRKLLELEENWHHVVTDDIAIIRIITLN